MDTINFASFLERAPCILGEGAVIERLRRNSGFELDPHIVNSAFIYEEHKRAALTTIYRGYLDVGREFDLPMMLSTPTWRATSRTSSSLMGPWVRTLTPRWSPGTNSMAR